MVLLSLFEDEGGFTKGGMLLLLLEAVGGVCRFTIWCTYVLRTAGSGGPNSSRVTTTLRNASLMSREAKTDAIYARSCADAAAAARSVSPVLWNGGTSWCACRP